MVKRPILNNLQQKLLDWTDPLTITYPERERQVRLNTSSEQSMSPLFNQQVEKICKGLFTYYVSREKGEGGVSQKLTIADEAKC